MAALDKYSGSWTKREAAHLLRRAVFGGSQADVNQAVEDGLDATITKLFTKLELPEPPLEPVSGLPWLDRGPGFEPGKGAPYYNALSRSWWTRQMIEQPVSIREKLTLFWHNHFATQWLTVQDPSMNFHMMQFMRENSLGNFKGMARSIAIYPAMLRFLNGNTNTVGNPNENFARELQELFTIGKGPVIGEGDYTYYTEQDVREAARVLTGWRDNRRTGGTVFVRQWHDTEDKKFSSHYQNEVIEGRSGDDAGAEELDDLIDMIFRQDRTAEYIVEELYRWFVDSVIDDQISEDVIKPLAAQLRADDYVVENVLRTLLASDYFFGKEMIGAQLGSPADFVIGLMRKSTSWSPPSDAVGANRFFLLLSSYMGALQMLLGDPPSVAGWEAYYQEPGYDQIWISTATYPLRNGMTDAALRPSRGNGGQPLVDSLAMISEVEYPGEALAMIDELNEIFFTIPFSEETRLKLAEEVLMDGGKHYEWAIVWDTYMADPSPANTLIIKTFTDRLFRYLFRMAEFQLV